jgi:hypothetical protein
MFDKFSNEVMNTQSSGLQCIMFDGRKDKTLSIGNGEGKSRPVRTTVVEEHIVVVSEPDGHYRYHFTPVSGGAADIAFELFEFIIKSKSEDTLLAVGADGTSVNTGSKAGAIRRLELILRRPLQYVICLLHMNELVLRHLFRLLDGATSGPSAYKGEIGKIITSDVTKLPPCEFKKKRGLMCPIKQNIADELSSDAKYLYEIATAIQNGPPFPERLAARNPGNLCESRWLTKANRILRYYVSCQKPSQKLIRL